MFLNRMKWLLKMNELFIRLRYLLILSHIQVLVDISAGVTEVLSVLSPTEPLTESLSDSREFTSSIISFARHFKAQHSSILVAKQIS